MPLDSVGRREFLLYGPGGLASVAGASQERNHYQPPTAQSEGERSSSNDVRESSVLYVGKVTSEKYLSEAIEHAAHKGVGVVEFSGELVISESLVIPSVINLRQTSGAIISSCADNVPSIRIVSAEDFGLKKPVDQFLLNSKSGLSGINLVAGSLGRGVGLSVGNKEVNASYYGSGVFFERISISGFSVGQLFLNNQWLVSHLCCFYKNNHVDVQVSRDLNSNENLYWIGGVFANTVGVVLKINGGAGCFMNFHGTSFDYMRQLISFEENGATVDFHGCFVESDTERPLILSNTTGRAATFRMQGGSIVNASRVVDREWLVSPASYPLYTSIRSVSYLETRGNYASSGAGVVHISAGQIEAVSERLAFVSHHCLPILTPITSIDGSWYIKFIGYNRFIVRLMRPQKHDVKLCYNI